MPSLRKLSGDDVVQILQRFGTCRAILRQASRYVTEVELRPHFYSQ